MHPPPLRISGTYSDALTSEACNINLSIHSAHNEDANPFKYPS